MIGKKGEVKPTTREYQEGDKDNETLIPGSRSLFETIESFTKIKMMLRKHGMKISRRLFHINLLKQITI